MCGIPVHRSSVFSWENVKCEYENKNGGRYIHGWGWGKEKIVPGFLFSRASRSLSRENLNCQQRTTPADRLFAPQNPNELKGKRAYHTRMHNGMSLKGDCGYELLLTDVTFKWFHSCVSSHVRLQLKLSTECLVTLNTFKRFVPCMHRLQNK